jgi:hypothetical protein
MPPVPDPPGGFQSIIVLVTVVVALCVRFWRTALRIVAIIVITLTICGAVLLTEALRHVGR